MKQLVFSTGNDSKYQTAQAVCTEYAIKLEQNTLEIDEIQGEDPEKIVTDKVNKAYDLLKKPVIVSDDTWVIPGLNGFPGSYMKSMNHWFQPQDFINLTLSLTDRRIFLVGYLAYKDEKLTKLFYQKREGILLEEPRGKHEPASHKVISMVGDNGLSIAEVYDKGLARSERDVAKIWHEFAEWFRELK
ncbi:hypothetical protein EPO05_06725 [Patescibacteria group bacterium]|nr:MAG: hypothetical protein EPO05_06725 [Patescibacteria group bacterium]